MHSSKGNKKIHTSSGCSCRGRRWLLSRTVGRSLCGYFGRAVGLGEHSNSQPQQQGNQHVGLLHSCNKPRFQQEEAFPANWRTETRLVIEIEKSTNIKKDKQCRHRSGGSLQKAQLMIKKGKYSLPLF